MKAPKPSFGCALQFDAGGVPQEVMQSPKTALGEGPDDLDRCRLGADRERPSSVLIRRSGEKVGIAAHAVSRSEKRMMCCLIQTSTGSDTSTQRIGLL